MIIGNEKKEVQSSNIASTSTFTINSSAKAFKILSDGLYSNKIAACVRELVCNAYDSHIAANQTEKKIKVNIPNGLRKVFSVEDFGVGLSEEEVYSLYTSYFASSKSTSNDFIGAFGLGSKAPFAYTNQFSIVSIKDGVKSSYICFISEDSTPQVTRVQQEQTNEHNGLKIEFPVSEKDHYSFEKEAKRILCWFDCEFDCNVSILPFSEVTSTVSDTLKDKVYYVDGPYMSRISAIMGNVVYPISLDSIGCSSMNIKLNNKEKLLLRFDIGQLDVAASREELSYDEPTIKIILEKLNEYADHLLKEDITNAMSHKVIADRLFVYENLRRTSTGYALKEFLHSNEQCGDFLKDFNALLAQDKDIQLVKSYTRYHNPQEIFVHVGSKVITGFNYVVLRAGHTNISFSGKNVNPDEKFYKPLTNPGGLAYYLHGSTKYIYIVGDYKSKLWKRKLIKLYDEGKFNKPAIMIKLDENSNWDAASATKVLKGIYGDDHCYNLNEMEAAELDEAKGKTKQYVWQQNPYGYYGSTPDAIHIENDRINPNAYYVNLNEIKGGLTAKQQDKYIEQCKKVFKDIDPNLVIYFVRKTNSVLIREKCKPLQDYVTKLFGADLNIDGTILADHDYWKRLKKDNDLLTIIKKCVTIDNDDPLLKKLNIYNKLRAIGFEVGKNTGSLREVKYETIFPILRITHTSAIVNNFSILKNYILMEYKNK